MEQEFLTGNKYSDTALLILTGLGLAACAGGAGGELGDATDTPETVSPTLDIPQEIDITPTALPTFTPETSELINTGLASTVTEQELNFFIDKLDKIFVNYSDEEIAFVADGFANSDFNQNYISDLKDIIYEPDGTLTEGFARFRDHDTDGIFDPVDPDFTGVIEADTDGDGIPDSQDPDIDGDFVNNEIDPDPRDPDSNNDGLIDYADWLTDVWLNGEPQNIVTLDTDITLVQDLGGRAMSLCDSEDVCSIIHTEIPSLDYLKQVFLNQGYTEQVATQSAVFYQKNFLDKEIRNTSLRMAEFLRRHSNEVSENSGGEIPSNEIALLADYLPVAAMSTEWKNSQPHLDSNITWDYSQDITPEMLEEAIHLKNLGHINGFEVGDSFSESTLRWIEATNSDPNLWVNFDNNPNNDK